MKIIQKNKKMGKTFRSVSAHSHSEHYKYDKCRGFQKKKMRSIQHGIRNDNRDSDETNFIKTKKKTNEHWASDYIGIANNVNCYLNSKSIERLVYEENRAMEQGNYTGKGRWSNNSLEDDISEMVNFLSLEEKTDRSSHNDLYYFKATLKQIKRRGKAKIFKGNHVDRNCESL